MHLLIPHAAPLADGARQAAAGAALPRLQVLLSRWTEVERDAGDEWNWSPPHERALARSFGWQGGSGLLPWAARAARADGVDAGTLAWGLVTPSHWVLGSDRVDQADPESLALDEAGSRALHAAVQPLFTGAGWALVWGAPLRWYAAHESLAALPTASLDRVIGRNVDAWLGADAGPVRRLQSEVQMLLHDHPVNAERQARGLPAVNSFWLSGCGVEQPETGPAPVVDDRLRRPALAADWPAWQQAWQALDAGPVARLADAARAGAAARLTLCGERASATFAPAARGGGFAGWWSRLRAGTASPAAVLESL